MPRSEPPSCSAMRSKIAPYVVFGFCIAFGARALTYVASTSLALVLTIQYHLSFRNDCLLTYASTMPAEKITPGSAPGRHGSARADSRWAGSPGHRVERRWKATWCRMHLHLVLHRYVVSDGAAAQEVGVLLATEYQQRTQATEVELRDLTGRCLRGGTPVSPAGALRAA